MNIYLQINGCISRELDFHRIKNYFLLNNCSITDEINEADYIIYSTCAVNADLVNLCMIEIQHLKTFNKKLILIGCLPAIMPGSISKFDCINISPSQLNDFDKVFPHFKIYFSKIPLSFQTIKGQKSKYLLDKVNLSKRIIFQLSFGKSFLKNIMFFNYHKKLINKKSAFLVASRGCNNHCTYCGIKMAVGHLISENPETIIEYYKALIANGNKHIIFYSDDTAAYGEDINASFSELLIKLDKISSDDITWELDFIHPQKLIEHFDTLLLLIQKKRIVILECPTQHLSQTILKKMNRNYNIYDVIDKLKILKKANKYLYIISHHIVGFPGETENDLHISIEIIKNSPFNFIEVLAFFENESCPAKKIFPKIEESIITERILILNKFLDESKILHALNSSFYIPLEKIKFRFVTNKEAIINNHKNLY